MQPEKAQNIRVVVGIDFGTSRSGYAYAFTKNSKLLTGKNSEIYGRTRWPGQTEPYPKTLSQSLYSSDGKMLAWGFEARKKLFEMKKNPEYKGNLDFFASFKMELHEEQGINHIPSIKTLSGREYLVTTLISDYLTVLKDEVLKEIEHNTAGYVNPTEILWCLTVPAIWTNKDKQLMKEAARKAGLIGIGYDEDQRLKLALEPEAAAIHCSKDAKFDLKEGERFMVVDCGGGTVDITVHEKITGNEIKELVAGTGGSYGSRYVDMEFLAFFRETLTSPVIDDLIANEHLEYLEILDAWERLKCNYDPKTKGDNLYIPFSHNFYRLLEKYPKVIEKLREAQKGEDDKLQIPRSNLEKMFNKIIDGIIHKINEQFSLLGQEHCDYLFLVGGFATSPLLQARVEKVFESRVKAVIIPPTPGAAIVEGAVLFGLQPNIIQSRITRYTYGCGSNNPFRVGIDPEAKRYWHQERNQDYCKDRFSIFVQEGERVAVDQKITQVFNPSESKQTSVGFKFYVSPNKEPQYTDENDATQIGNLNLESPVSPNGIDRQILVTFYFGRTEIEVEAIDKDTGKQMNTQLEFHT